MAARLVRPLYVRLDYRTGKAVVPRPPVASNRDGGAPRVLPDLKTAPERAHEPLPPPTKNLDDRSIKVLRDKESVAANGEPEQGRQVPIGGNGLSAKPRPRRRDSDDHIGNGTLIAATAGVIAVSFAITAFLPSILTRDPVDFGTTVVAPPAPVQPAQTAQFGAAGLPTPGLRPSQNPPAAQPSPASNDATSVSNTEPVLNAGKAAAEKAAVARAPQELEKSAAVSAPRPARPARPALTDAEKAAVERGLRELEKAAGQAKQ